MCNGSSFRTLFDSQRVSVSKKMLESSQHHFYTNLSLIWDNLSWKKLLRVTCEILGLLVNTLTGNDKYSFHSREKFQQQVEMQLSKKQKLFLNFSLRFWNLHQILSIFQTKDESQSLCISEIIDFKRGDYLNVNKLLLHITLRESTRWRVQNNAEIFTAPLLYYFHIPGKLSGKQIRNLRTVS